MDKLELSYFQHLTLIHIAECISKAQGSKDIRLIVQDPAYDALSEEMLSYISKDYTHKFKIVQDPEAFEMVDHQTILFHCHMTFDAAEAALTLAGEKDLAGIMGRPIEEDHQQLFTGGIMVFEGDMRDLKFLNSTMKYERRQKCEDLKLDIHADPNWYGVNAPTHFYLKNKNL